MKQVGGFRLFRVECPAWFSLIALFWVGLWVVFAHWASVESSFTFGVCIVLG